MVEMRTVAIRFDAEWGPTGRKSSDPWFVRP